MTILIVLMAILIVLNLNTFPTFLRLNCVIILLIFIFVSVPITYMMRFTNGFLSIVYRLSYIVYCLWSIVYCL